MKRNLNENAQFDYDDSVKICVSEIRKDDPELDCNKLRDLFVEEGAEVEGQHGQYKGEPATFMIVSNLMEDDIIDILNDFLGESEYVATAESYIIPDNVETDYIVEPEKSDFPAYEDVDLDPEQDALNDEDNVLNEETDIVDEAKAELRDVLSALEPEESIEFTGDTVVLDSVDGEFIGIDGEGNLISEDDVQVNAFDLMDSDDIYVLCDIIKDEIESSLKYPDYDDVNIDDEVEPTFEKIHRGHRLEEKKGKCCPGKNTINEAEAIDAVLADIDAQIVNESKEVENSEETEVKHTPLEIKTLKALSENKDSLHSNISYNGKTFDKMTLKELKKIYETINASVEVLSSALNESAEDEKLLNTINNKKQLLNYLDEEITYRTTRYNCLKQLNEEGAEISDEELKNLFGPAQGEDETPAETTEEQPIENSEENKEESSDENKDENSEENKEDDNVVELSRIVITLKDAEAANDLKQACIEAEIPEDAFELENVEEESATEDEENSEETPEETSEETSEESTEETSDENTNESYEYAKYVKMLMEGEVPEESSEENTEETSEETPEESTEENSDENKEDEEDKQPKFILTDTDYASKLAKVLEDVYGISKDEFEEMIGGPIVEEDKEEKSEESSEDNKEEKSEESSEESSEEEIDPSDLFKNL